MRFIANVLPSILETVRLLMSMKIDRVKNDKLAWSEMYGDQNTAQYQNLEDEVNYAVMPFLTHQPPFPLYLSAEINYHIQTFCWSPQDDYPTILPCFSTIIHPALVSA